MMNMNLHDYEKAALFDQIAALECEEIIRIDSDTGEGNTLCASDEKWEKTIGLSYQFEETMRSYLMSCSVDSNTEKLMSAMDMAHIRKYLKRRGSYIVYYAVQGKQGSVFIKKALFFQDKTDMTWLVIRDITQEYENAGESLKELDYAVKTAGYELDKRNTFLNMMNRNIRAPLHSILGLTKIAEEHMENNSSLDAYLHKISMSGTYMSETIDDILDLRRIANNEIVLNPEPLRLHTFLERIHQMFYSMCEDRHLIFSSKFDISPDLVVQADLHALQQILMKLLQSAMSYTVRGGRVKLNVRELIRKGNTVSIEFSVDCIGIVIDQERLKTMFQPYDYLLAKIEEDIGSLDTALIILRSYASAMGTDTLLAESDESRGTKVSLTLSFEISGDSKAKEDAAIAELIPKLKGLKVLVVDDNETNLEVSEKILGSKGMSVTTASNGKEAVELFAETQGQFDLIIMDILMPVMDGLEAARQIRAMKGLPAAGSVPIIAMTVNAFRENFEESFQAGMNAHLVKPINPDRLLLTMADVLKDRI